MVELNVHQTPEWAWGPDPLAAGTRIELIEMPRDPNPVPPGSRGTVDLHANPLSVMAQIWITWDPPVRANLALVPGVDRFRIIHDKEDA